MADQQLDQLLPDLTVTNLERESDRSDENGDRLSQLQALVCGAGRWSADPAISLLAWSETEQKWYRWNHQ